ncbi:FAST kinase domain-containing protein 2, mitochondrial isoform 1-T2 [Discoglossus pictus]
MSNKAYFCALRTLRHLQTCDSAVGSIFKSRTIASRAALLSSVTKKVNTLRLSAASSGTNVSFRYLSQETPVSIEEKNAKSELEDQTLVNVPQSSAQGTAPMLKGKSSPNELNALEEDETAQEPWVPSSGKTYSQSEIFEALQKCTSPSDVLDMCNRASMTMNVISNCFTTMWETCKKIGAEQRRYETQLMYEHPNFGSLCRLAMEGAPRMHSNDLVYTLHAAVKLQVFQRSRLVQTLLRVCQERLNEFQEREISVLASSLDGMESCKNVDALRSGLRLLVEMRMPSIRGVMPLQTMMRCIGKDAPLSLKKKLEKKALQMMSQFTVPNSQFMFSTLAAINLRSPALLDACSQKLIDNLDALPFWRLIHVLQACRELSYRNEQLLTAIGDYILATRYMWQTKQLTLILSLLENLSFRHVALLDSFAETVIQSPESLTLKDLVISVKVYSLLNHLPEGQSQQFLEAFNTSLQLYLLRMPPVELLRIVYSFCILGYFPQKPLDSLLKEEILQELLTSANQNVEINERMLHSINLCLELDKPSITKPHGVVLGKSSTANLPAYPEVYYTLQSIVGDSSLFRQNLQLPNDYYIDFEMALDTEQIKIVPVDDTYQPSITRVAVLCAPISSFCLGTLHPLGKLAMKMRHLKTLGYHVVLVPVHEFGKLDEVERAEFLRSRIFSGEPTSAQELDTEHVRD